ncbi:MAG: tetratricopeptide repeat protein, partial [Anaerolineales bacterium]|nr:tetratricopeptide repeat protein [Anaerolineales bacterium]
MGAIAAPRADAGEIFELRARLAEALLASGEWQAAADEYESQLLADDNASRQARALVLSGDIYYNNGNAAHAYEHYQDALSRFPQSPHTFQGLLKLVNEGVAVDDFQRGLVNYHAANYEPALAAFERVLATEPNNTQAQYQKALTLNALQRNA